MAGFKGLYPFLARWIAKIHPKPGKVMVWVLLLFMAVNMTVSAMALTRYSDRAAGKPATKAWEVYMDQHYDDGVMKRIYPYAKMTA